MSEEQGRILVVDDNRMNRIKLSRNLEQQGYAVGLAEGGEQALDMLQVERFDAVLLDIVMPRMDGYAVLERIKGDTALRDIPIIVISALDEIESAVRCIEMGAEDYLPKSFDPVLLRARLNASLQKKKLRDLEKAYLQQELMLRQSEKMAALGTLSAGLAHELNNPAAAVRRSATQLHESLASLQRHAANLGALNPSPEAMAVVNTLRMELPERATSPVKLNPLARSDQEGEVGGWLEEQGVDQAWELAPAIVALGWHAADLEELTTPFTVAQKPVFLCWLATACTVYALLDEVSQGAGRISEIVKAVKSYSYLDQAPVQLVDVHEGIENTLIILRHKLKGGVTVVKDYAPDLPRIEAYASELNQVWTNLIDNAIDAMNGHGEIRIRTYTQAGPTNGGAGQTVVVEISDNGPGIPPELQGRVFDAFFTTKEPGKGTGLGLHITYNIVVNRHHGEIKVESQPGQTIFQVTLPAQLKG